MWCTIVYGRDVIPQAHFFLFRPWISLLCGGGQVVKVKAPCDDLNESAFWKSASIHLRMQRALGQTGSCIWYFRFKPRERMKGLCALMSRQRMGEGRAWQALSGSAINNRDGNMAIPSSNGEVPFKGEQSSLVPE